MVALMCGCCCDKKPQNFTFFGIICFFSVYVVDNRKYGYSDFKFSVALGPDLYTSENSRFFHTQASFSDVSGLIGPPVDDPDNGDWDNGFYVDEQGRRRKSNDAPSIDPSLSILASYIPSNLEYYGIKINGKIADVGLTFSEAMSVYCSYIRSNYNQAVSAFRNGDFAIEIALHKLGVY